ncbi:hypothetical protein [Aquipseudomonas alcaligenes]|uniref:hypothetical protein n=1 Tax=Aquipseudomonas alcaligenes TaxID=43263 RepID=UPI0016599EE5|nr:hypothetical protein [Pseudomonas alcaligenes]
MSSFDARRVHFFIHKNLLSVLCGHKIAATTLRSSFPELLRLLKEAVPFPKEYRHA